MSNKNKNAQKGTLNAAKAIIANAKPVNVIPSNVHGSTVRKVVLAQNSAKAEDLLAKQAAAAKVLEDEVAAKLVEEAAKAAEAEELEFVTANKAIIAAAAATGDVDAIIAAVAIVNTAVAARIASKVVITPKTAKTAGAAKKGAIKYMFGISSMEKLGVYCFANKLSAEATKEAFVAGYALKGVTDDKFITDRIAIYLNIARKANLAAKKAVVDAPATIVLPSEEKAEIATVTENEVVAEVPTV